MICINQKLDPCFQKKSSTKLATEAQSRFAEVPPLAKQVFQAPQKYHQVQLPQLQYNHFPPTPTIMTTPTPSHSRTPTHYSEDFNKHLRKDSFSLHLKDFSLRKSLFYPPEGLAEAYASRNHIAGAQVPLIEIIHYTPRWLLLQTRKAKPTFFQKANLNLLGCNEDQILKIFNNFVALSRHYGYFRPTQKMIFLERKQVKVWINEDIFSITPSMPIRGAEGQKDFIIAFLAMVETNLNQWDRVFNLTTIADTLKMLQWRCQLAQRRKNAFKASQEAYYKSGQSQIYFLDCEAKEWKVTSSQLLSDSKDRELKISRPSFNTSKHSSLVKREGSMKLIRGSMEINNQQQFDPIYVKKRFALNSTTSTIGAFCEKWRTTHGRKKLMEKMEKLQEPASPVSNQGHNGQNFPPPNIQMEFEDLFAEERDCDEEELQKIAQQIEDVLFW